MKICVTILISLLWVNAHSQRDTIKVLMLTSSHAVEVLYGWDVRELRNTIQKDSPVVICCHDYWQHIEYLSESKKRLCAIKELCTTTVWAAIDSNWIRNELVKK